MPAVILAGGQSRRMGGREKALLMLNGRPLVAHVAERVARQCAPVAINANGDPARFSRIGLPVVADPVPDTPGPLAGILAAMLFARSVNAEAVITVAADTPFFPSDLAARLQEAAGPGGLAIAAATDRSGSTRSHPVFGHWPVSLAEILEKALREGVRKVEDFTQTKNARMAAFESAGFDPFFNINTPEHLDEARRLFAGNPAIVAGDGA